MPPKISAVLIAKNEAKVLERCLRSLLQAASEIVVCDTGSSDDTVKIAERYHAKVVRMTPPSPFHFAEARNFATKHAENDWILSIDADEVLRSGMARKIRGAMEENETATAFRITFTDRGFVTHKKKLFDRRAWSWRYRVHERIHGGRPEDVASAHDVVMEHLPDTDKRPRRAQNIELLKIAVTENPEYTRLFRHLGQELVLDRRWSEAIPPLAEYVEKTDEDILEKSQVMVHLARCYFETGRPEDGRTWFEMAASTDPRRREPLYFCAWYLIKDAKIAPDLALAIEYLVRCLAIDPERRPKSRLDEPAAWGAEPDRMLRFCKEQISMARPAGGPP